MSGGNPLSLAIEKVLFKTDEEDFKILTFLLENDANPKTSGAFLKTPLELLKFYGYNKIDVGTYEIEEDNFDRYMLIFFTLWRFIDQFDANN